MNKLTAVEKETLFDFLKDLEDRMGNAGCNDFIYPATPEGRQFAENVVNAVYDDSEKEELLDDIKDAYETGGPCYGYDWIVVIYLKKRLEEVL